METLAWSGSVYLHRGVKQNRLPSKNPCREPVGNNFRVARHPSITLMAARASHTLNPSFSRSDTGQLIG